MNQIFKSEPGLRLCALSEIPEGGSKGLKVDNLTLFAVKHHNTIFLYRNACPHLGIPLEWNQDQFLDSSHTMIQCANHGALFLIKTGKCVAGPCSGRTLDAVPFKIKDDAIWI